MRGWLTACEEAALEDARRHGYLVWDRQSRLWVTPKAPEACVARRIHSAQVIGALGRHGLLEVQSATIAHAVPGDVLAGVPLKRCKVAFSCMSCGDQATRLLDGRTLCVECYEELAHGVIPEGTVHLVGGHVPDPEWGVDGRYHGMHTAGGPK